jgi:hypothetical protein
MIKINKNDFNTQNKMDVFRFIFGPDILSYFHCNQYRDFDPLCLIVMDHDLGKAMNEIKNVLKIQDLTFYLDKLYFNEIYSDRVIKQYKMYNTKFTENELNTLCNFFSNVLHYSENDVDYSIEFEYKNATLTQIIKATPTFQCDKKSNIIYDHELKITTSCSNKKLKH